MASAMSVTANSSKQSTHASSAKRRRHGPDGIVALDLAGLQLRAPGVNALVHVGHEGMEMDPALAPHRQCVEKQVHQHGLAAADRRPRCRARAAVRLAPAEQPGARARWRSCPASR